MDLERVDRRGFSRRAFLLGALGATSASVLAACGGGTSAPATTAPAAAAPTKPAAAASPAAACIAASPLHRRPPPPRAPLPVPSLPRLLRQPPPHPRLLPPRQPPPPNRAPRRRRCRRTSSTMPRRFAAQKIVYYGDGVGPGGEMEKAATLSSQGHRHPGHVHPAPTGCDRGARAVPALLPGPVVRHRRHERRRDLARCRWRRTWSTSVRSSRRSQACTTRASSRTTPSTASSSAMPWFADFGMLYYRTDLLQKYGVQQAAQDLGRAAATGQEDRRRREGAPTPNFAGLRLPGQGLRRSDLQRAGVARLERRRHDRRLERQGDRQQPAGRRPS